MFGCGSKPGFWLLVALQIAIPLGYYLGPSDQDDERFAWRMFSSVRFRRCRVEATEDRPEGSQPLVLNHVLHASWIGSLRRGRRRVVEAFLADRCRQDGTVRRAVLLRRCSELTGQRLPAQRFVYECGARELSGPLELLP